MIFSFLNLNYYYKNQSLTLIGTTHKVRRKQDEFAIVKSTTYICNVFDRRNIFISSLLILMIHRFHWKQQSICDGQIRRYFFNGFDRQNIFIVDNDDTHKYQRICNRFDRRNIFVQICHDQIHRYFCNNFARVVKCHSFQPIVHCKSGANFLKIIFNIFIFDFIISYNYLLNT